MELFPLLLMNLLSSMLRLLLFAKHQMALVGNLFSKPLLLLPTKDKQLLLLLPELKVTSQELLLETKLDMLKEWPKVKQQDTNPDSSMVKEKVMLPDIQQDSMLEDLQEVPMPTNKVSPKEDLKEDNKDSMKEKLLD